MLCPKCKAEIQIPDLSVEIKEKVASSVRKGDVLQTIAKLSNETDIDLAQGKFIAFHLTKKYGFCHRCQTKLTEQTEEQICPKCHSLNLNW
jgi:Zn finger protein HypA/HybF involved in hydrogenase expression